MKLPVYRLAIGLGLIVYIFGEIIGGLALTIGGAVMFLMGVMFKVEDTVLESIDDLKKQLEEKL